VLAQLTTEDFLAKLLREKYNFTDCFNFTQLVKQELGFLTESFYIWFSFGADVSDATMKDIMRTIMIVLCNFDGLRFSDAATCNQEPIRFEHELLTGHFYVSRKVLELTQHGQSIRLLIKDQFLLQTVLLIGMCSSQFRSHLIFQWLCWVL
jgi:hypothetical protein